MKIIYSCFGGAHSSVVTAAIHMGYLPNNSLPSKEEILAVPFYDKAQNNEIGIPHYMGKDQNNHIIYIMGMGHARDYYTEMLYEFYNEVAPYNNKDIIIINVTSLLNNYTRLGGFMSRRLNIISLGRPLTVFGIQKNYFYFAELVKNLKERIN
ncbi:Protein of unknown function [Natronincola peptidivorans]|uniref:DUF3189 domain-containing protein n=1 Tax=Natronincola peptidivorans TaxID=426128 RepID=A0A1H9Y8D4_9FIRM|nr:DUF3189 family protein [Natronincola peptidivorans]SES65064.1 Protein of unknown function [Natronincola peptidivorans]